MAPVDGEPKGVTLGLEPGLGDRVGVADGVVLAVVDGSELGVVEVVAVAPGEAVDVGLGPAVAVAVAVGTGVGVGFGAGGPPR